MSALANPWIIARAAFSLLTLVLAAYSVFRSIAAYRYVRNNEKHRTDERALTLERDAEELQAMISSTFVLHSVGILATILLAHRLAGALRGAMCAQGTFAASPFSSWLFGSTPVSLGLVSAWLGVHFVDRQLRRGYLLSTLTWLGAISSVSVVVDSLLVLRFLLSLDLTATVTCCTINTTGRIAEETSAVFSTPQAGFLGVSSALSLFLLLVVQRNRNQLLVVGLGLASLANLYAQVLFTRNLATPHIYETATHPCVWCLLRNEAFPWGFFALLGLFIQYVLVCAILGTAMIPANTAAETERSASLSRLSRMQLAVWLSSSFVASMPIVLFRYKHGIFLL